MLISRANPDLDGALKHPHPAITKQGRKSRPPIISFLRTMMVPFGTPPLQEWDEGDQSYKYQDQEPTRESGFFTKLFRPTIGTSSVQSRSTGALSNWSNSSSGRVYRCSRSAVGPVREKRGVVKKHSSCPIDLDTCSVWSPTAMTSSPVRANQGVVVKTSDGDRPIDPIYSGVRAQASFRSSVKDEQYKKNTRPIDPDTCSVYSRAVSSCASVTTTATEQTGDIRLSIYAQPSSSFVCRPPLESRIDELEDSRGSQKSLFLWSRYAPLAKDAHDCDSLLETPDIACQQEHAMAFAANCSSSVESSPCESASAIGNGPLSMASSTCASTSTVGNGISMYAYCPPSSHNHTTDPSTLTVIARDVNEKSTAEKPMFLDNSMTSFAVDIVLEEPLGFDDDELEMEPPIFACEESEMDPAPILPWEMSQYVNRSLYPSEDFLEVEEEEEANDD